MLSIIAGVLCVLSVLLLTMPWARREPGAFSPVEVGYAARGPVGGLLAAVRLLKQDRLVEVLPRLDEIRRKEEQPPPTDADPLVCAVFAALQHPQNLPRLLDIAEVDEELQTVGNRVQQAGLRIGPARRIVGSAVAVAAPVVTVMGLAGDAQPVVVVAVTVVSAVVAAATLRLRGMTVAGLRTFGAARVRYITAAMPRVRSIGAGAIDPMVGPYTPHGREGSFGTDFGGGGGGGGGGD